MEGDMEEGLRNAGEPEPSMLEVIRVLMEEQRRSDVIREDARRAEDERREETRLAREVEIRRAQAEQQAAIEVRQYQQQLELIRLQADMGKEASRVHRETQLQDRKKDRALFSVPALKEGEDLEDFLVMIEGRMEAAEIGRDEWVASISSKLTGRLASTWREITLATEDYATARARLLEGSGYTAMTAADKFYGFRQDQCKGLSAGELYQKGQQLARRMVAPGVPNPEIEFAWLRGWVGSVIPKRARAAIDNRKVTNAVELVAALQDHLALEGDTGSGQTAVFKGRSANEGHQERRGPITCYTCGKVGHRSADCWQAKNREIAPKAGVAVKIVCYTCGEEGHKSPQCPRNMKGEKAGSKGAQPKPVKRVWQNQTGCVQLEGSVNGHQAQVLLDSGADISVVPEDMVEPTLMSGGKVAVKPFGATTSMLLPLAEVAFEIGDLKWSEVVAVAPMLEGGIKEVLCSLKLQSERGLQLVLMANGIAQKDVARVTTRAQAKSDSQEEEEIRASIAKDKPTVRTLVPNGQEGSDEPGEGVELMEEEKNDLGCLIEDDEQFFGIEECASDDEEVEEECYKMKEKKEGGVDLEIPPVKIGRHSRRHLVKETREDPTLHSWRDLADKGEKGLVWKEGLMFQAVTTQVLESELVLVLPKVFRLKVLRLAHDALGHMGARRVKALLRARFSWPGLGKDVVEYCKSCPSCQTCAKNPARKVPLLERRVFSEPFEVMGFDLVGPMPKGKGGCQYLLTAICMATKWPEAIPLRSISAKAVAMGMAEIFCRTGIPLQLVTDQGTQFVGKMVECLCSNMRIEKIKTTPYHPEGNGVCERMHGTLGAMLTKAAKAGQDWVGQVPFALFALRAAPNRDTKFSPFELVYGRRVRTPLDILHQGWVETEFQELNTEEWAQWLVEKLEVWHEVMHEKAKEAGHKRKEGFDKKTVRREFEVGDMVLCRVPGMIPKLKESWHGPYPIIRKMNRVDYEVDVGRGRCKVLHIN